MVREIKFRAWDGDNMVYQYLVARPQMANVLSVMTSETFAKEQYGLKEWKLMQFTGLTDTKGEEIYEGDILRVKYHREVELEEQEYSPVEGFVDWNEHNSGWILRCKSPMSVNADGTVMSSMYGQGIEREVIGNIHEDKHLLQ